ncbi:hypothetical protein Vretifemale_3223, partial [Volvox reticuliferus]
LDSTLTPFQPSGCDEDAAVSSRRASCVSHSRAALVEGPGMTKLRSVCFKAVAMGIVLDLSLDGHVPAAAVMAENETFHRAARLDVAKAVANTSGANEVWPWYSARVERPGVPVRF